MSYKEKPQLKLFKFINNSFVLQAIIDDYAEVSFEHNLYQAGVFTITINYNIPNSQLFQRVYLFSSGTTLMTSGKSIQFKIALAKMEKVHRLEQLQVMTQDIF